MRDANIDAFWGREESTVASNLREGIRMEKTMERLGIPCATPPMVTVSVGRFVWNEDGSGSIG